MHTSGAFILTFIRTIWQCNYKFKNEHKCETPNLNEEEIKMMFLKAYKEMMTSKEAILTNLSEALKEVDNLEDVEKRIEGTKTEIEETAKEVEDLIYLNLDKTSDNAKEKELEEKYDALVIKLKGLEQEKADRVDKSNKIKSFISSLSEGKIKLNEFDEVTFNIMVEKAIVHRDKSIEFVFHSGYKVTVEAEE